MGLFLNLFQNIYLVKKQVVCPKLSRRSSPRQRQMHHQFQKPRHRDLFSCPRDLASCPKIKCYWGFNCAFCFDAARHKFPICERHIHKWETLNHQTKVQVYSHVNLFNKGYTNRRQLQIFIHRVEVLDELNRIKSFYVNRGESNMNLYTEDGVSRV